MHSIIIRKATPQDAHVIGKIYHQSWLATYPNEEVGISVQDIVNLNLDSEENAKERALKLANPGSKSHRYVAEIDGTVVGHCGFEIHPTHGYLRSIYVLPEYISRGVGAALMQKAIEIMAECPEIILSVVTYNERAIRFYERWGFAITEAPRPEIHESPFPNGKTIPQFHMARSR